MNAIWKYITMLTGITCLTAFSAQAIEVSFAPPSSGTVLAPMPLIVNTNPSDNIDAIKIKFRIKGSHEFNELSFSDRGNGEFFLAFQPLVKPDSEIEYNLAVTQKNRETVILPNTPESLYYSLILTSKPQQPEFQVITPKGPILTDSRPIFVISIKDEYAILKPDTLKLTLKNNPNIKLNTQVTPLFISAELNQNVSEGNDLLVIQYEDTLGKKNTSNLPIIFRSDQHRFIQTFGSVKVKEKLTSTTQTNSGQLIQPHEFMFEMDANAKSDFEIDASAHVLMDNRESNNTQKLSRYTGKIFDRTNAFSLILGDSTPYFSDLGLRSTSLDGLNISADLLRWAGLSDLLNVTYLEGNTQRSIKANDTILSGTFQQRIRAARISSNLLGLNNQVSVARFTDLSESLTTTDRGSSLPIQDTVIAARSELKLDNNTRFSAEAAGTVYYSNLEAVEVDTSQLSLPISQSLAQQLFTYFPPKSSIVLGAAAKGNMQFPIFDPHYLFQGEIVWAMPGYTNLSDLVTRRDSFEYSTNFNISFLDGLLIIQPGYKKRHDNILKTQENTTHTTEYSLNNTVTIPNLFGISTAYIQSNRANTKADNSPVSESNKIQNLFNALSFSLFGLNTELFGIATNLGFQYSLNQFSDQKTPANNNTGNSYGANAALTLEKMRLLFDFSQSNSKGAGDSALSSGSSYFHTGVAYDLVPNFWILRTDGGVTLTKTTSADNSSNADITLYQIGVGSDTTFDNLAGFKNVILSESISGLFNRDAKNPNDTDVSYRQWVVQMSVSSQF